jgi:hypothetical protein
LLPITRVFFADFESQKAITNFITKQILGQKSAYFLEINGVGKIFHLRLKFLLNKRRREVIYSGVGDWISLFV